MSVHNEMLSIPTSREKRYQAGPLPLYRTGSDGKLGGAWVRGYLACAH